MFQLGIFNPDPSPVIPRFRIIKKNISESGCGEIEFAIAVRERRSHSVFTQNGTRRYLLREKTSAEHCSRGQGRGSFFGEKLLFLLALALSCFLYGAGALQQFSPAFSSALNRREPDYHIWLVSEHFFVEGLLHRTLRETHSGTRRCGTNPRVARERPNFSEASDIGSPSTAFEPNGEGLVHGWKRDRERSV